MRRLKTLIIILAIIIVSYFNFFESSADSSDGLTEDMVTLTFDSQTMMSWRHIYESNKNRGQWKLQSDYVVNTENTDNTSGYFNPTENYADMDVSVRIRSDNSDDDWMGIMAHVSGAGGTEPVRLYAFWLDRTDLNGGIGQHSGLFKVDGKTFSYANHKKLANVAKQWKRGTWLTLRMVLKNNVDGSVNIKCYYDNQLVIDYTDRDNPILSGSYGFCSFSQADARFKDITGSVTLAKYKINFDSVNGHFPEQAYYVARPYPGRSDMMQKTVMSTKKYGDTYGDNIHEIYGFPKPMKDYNVFVGWYDSPYGGNEITKDTKVNIENDQTIYAHWRETKVTCYDYDLQTGAFLGSNTYSGRYSLNDTASGADFGEITSYGYYYSGEKYIPGSATTCKVGETDSKNIVYRYFTQFTDVTSMNVKTPDITAPNIPDNAMLVKPEDYYHVAVAWAPQKDNGTTYYHKVTSYDKKTFKKLTVSRPSETVITSKTKGYLYYVDSKPTSLVTKKNGVFTAVPVVSINLIDNYGKMKQFVYLHIATIDNAGNISQTYDVPYNLANMALQLYTDKIKISDTPNVYLKDSSNNSYYVQGSKNEMPSKFNLSFNGFIKVDGSYFRQVNDLLFETKLNNEKQVVNIFTPNTHNAKAWQKSDNFGILENPSGILEVSNLVATRTQDLKTLNTNIEVATFKPDNTTIEIMPEARTINDFALPFSSRDEQYLENGTKINGAELDKKNKIKLIVDAQAPVLTNDVVYDNKNDVPVISKKTDFVINYADYIKDVNPSDPEYGSGIKKNTERVTVTFIQEQTSLTKIYKESTADSCVKIEELTDKSGQIHINIDPYKYQEMSGFVTIKVDLQDNVGNTSTKEYRFLILTVDAAVKNVDALGVRSNPSIFVAGEQGEIITKINGFTDQVEIKFPESLENAAKEETTTTGQYDSSNQSSEIVVDRGRVLSDIYPRSNTGEAIRVLPELQTQYWGSKDLGGMEYKNGTYEHTYLTHFFYAPTYAVLDKYNIVVTAYKEDPKNPGHIYSVSKTLPIYIGVDENGNLLGNITTEFTDKIQDN